MSTLSILLDSFRCAAVTEREKGTYFEELVVAYLRNEPTYKDYYSDVWTYADWAKSRGLDGKDAGIDLVAKTAGTEEFHAIQCKFYSPDYKVQKADIDSFFTASGKKPFTRRVIVATTDLWSEHAEDALLDQQPPVTKIDLQALEESLIDWGKFKPTASAVLRSKKNLRPHQREALSAVTTGLALENRGKLIMACGTGKTFTSLKIAEVLAGKGKRVLFLVPSLALLSQALTEWSQESTTPLHCFAVCSDSDVGKKRKVEDDIVQTFTHELRYPATTESAKLAQEMAKRQDSEHMSVVFGTYHSIEVVHDAQTSHGLGAFDLVICDEAHRTTGATFDDQDESAFVRIHDSGYILATKRLYMTATPRIYGDSAKATAQKNNIAICSMDDEALYGKQLHVITFSEAVKRGLLVDYKVLVLAVEESHVNRSLADLLKSGKVQLRVDDAAKIVGCWKALAKQGVTHDLPGDEAPMKRAVAFCQVIEPAGPKAKTHKVSSKNIATIFQAVVEEYQKQEEVDEASRLICEAAHVDGSMNASEKEAKLNWLKEPTPESTCRILSNVRCLSEGVDVPALDAVLFLTPRNSQVDVVQSVGRVMRNAPGKKRGYVILPVVIPAGVEPHEALNDNTTYAVVWQVLQALRSHDDRFDAMVNKLELNGPDPRKMEVIAVCGKVPAKAAKSAPASKKLPKKGAETIGMAAETPVAYQADLPFQIGEIEKAIYAKVVQKCGNRHHWEEWAADIAKIARTHIDRITGILENSKNLKERDAFQAFAKELRDDLNDSITDVEIIEMLAQHLITKPVFDALFADYSFASNNPISQAMQGVLDLLQEHRLEQEADTLAAFYDSVKLRADGIDSAEGKQKIVVELYDKFFRNAFPKMTERLGIVYTPVEVVDFILHSVNHLLKAEFDQTLGSKGVHIIDPFVGTGTFITRLLQSGLIHPEELGHKYRHEIHANEIVLLAYYIAAINIEATYHALAGGPYVPFEGICLTDTFQLYEKEDMLSQMLEDNSARRKRQKKLDIRVIVGNPPYSAGQTNANDNNANVTYPGLDERIRTTYAARSTATLKNALYDSYIRAIRWASDRVGKSGVIGFVTNGGFLEANTADGLRKCLAEEFSSIHVFHLRGNARTSGEQRRKEKDNVFGMGTRAPIAISFFVKNPAGKEQGQIRLHDIGDYLTRDEKLEKITEFQSVAGIEAANGWRAITPDEHGDWLKQRDDSFSEFIVMGDKDGETGERKLFGNYSNGVKTNRDAWVFNFSKSGLWRKVEGMIEVYNSEVRRYIAACKGHPRSSWPDVDSFLDFDSTKMSWTREVKQDLGRHRSRTFIPEGVVIANYRPFTKTWMYFNQHFNNCVYQMPRIFPNTETENLVIQINAKFNGYGEIALISDCLPDIHCNGDSQCFPLYLYDESAEATPQGLFKEKPSRRARRDAITDEGLAHFQEAFPGEKITKQDLFYYIYGLLHSPDYRERYADNLSKELPRIPRVKTAEDFWAFSKAGRALADLHLNYERVEPYPVQVVTTGTLPDASYRVEKMRYGKAKVDGKTVEDKTTLVYNDHITLKGIPLDAYDYVVNGRPALDWVVERQCVKTDKDSGIVNDANAWAIETMKNPKYPLELFMRVITVSLETMRIVKSLPALELFVGALVVEKA